MKILTLHNMWMQKRNLGLYKTLNTILIETIGVIIRAKYNKKICLKIFLNMYKV